MPGYRYTGYRGSKVPIVRTKMIPGEEGKKDPRMHAWPRSDWVNPGEHIPIVRHKSKIFSQAAPIPRRVKKK